MKYFYIVSENKAQVFTSRLFDTIEDAVKSFMTEDAPAHYPHDTFTATVTGSHLHNELAAEKRRITTPGVDHRQYRPRVYVYFHQVEPQVIPMIPWCEAVKNTNQQFKFDDHQLPRKKA